MPGIEPPDPGIPQSTIDDITRCTFRDGGFVATTGMPLLLAVVDGAWCLSASGQYSVTATTYSLLHGARSADPQHAFVANNGKGYVLTRARLTDGTLLAVAAPIVVT